MRRNSGAAAAREWIEQESFLRAGVEMRNLKTAKSKMRRLKLRMLKVRRREMKSHPAHRVSKALASTLVLVALLISTVVPALAQTKRKPRLRRRAPVQRVVKPVVVPAAPIPAPVYLNVISGQIIRVRMNSTITS